MFSRLALWCSCALLVSAATPKKTKRGLAFAAGDTPGDLNNANQTKSLISWQYDWGLTPPAYIASSGIDYIPMQWGSGKIELFSDAVKAQDAKTILSFNEPDYDKESNMLPSDAAKLWKQYLEPLKADGIRLGGPAVTASATGRPWMTEFMTLCTNCTVDFIPIHWYGEGEEGFYNYLWDVHTAFPNKTIWVTEYASTSANVSEVASFLNATTIYMDGLDWIERYAWFGYFRPKEGFTYNLLDEQGGLNVLGQMYVGAKTVHTQIVSQAPSKTYQTVNGADNPTQGLVTTYPAAANGAMQHWNIFTGQHLWSLGTALLGSAIGVIWTIC